MKRGSSLINVLFLSMALFGLLFATSSTWLFQLGLSSRSEAQEGCRRLAEATAQTAVARLLKQNDAQLPDLSLSLPAYPGGTGLLSTDQGRARALGIDNSANNLTGSLGTSAAARWGRVPVPAERACLVAVGRWRGQEQRLEVILHVPEFPYVLGSSVPLKGENLNVFAVASQADLANGIAAVPDDKKEPGHVVTNALDAGPLAAMRLGGLTQVEGDAQSRGSIELTDSVSIKGERRPQAELVPLPDIDFASLDPISRAEKTDITTGSLNQPPPFEGFYRANDNLIISGGLELNGAVIYVNGSVTVAGGIRGKGALIATRDVTVSGDSQFTGDQQAGIVAGGNVQLHGTSGAEYRGLIYTEGNLDVNNIQVAGSVVVNNPAPTGLSQFTDAGLVQTPGAGRLRFPVTSSVPGTPPGMQSVADFGYHAYAWGPAFDVNSGQPWMDIKMKWDPMNYDNPDPALFKIVHPKTPAEPWVEIAAPDSPPADMIGYGKLRIGVCEPGSGALRPGESWQEERSRAASAAAIMNRANAWAGGIDQGMIDAYLDGAEQKVRDLLPEYIRVFNENSRSLGQRGITVTPGTAGYTRTEDWTLDLSTFYNLSDRVRILSWRTI
ncbi:MAG: hypothetical protein KF760_24460 [Candidatus Eremiobacteraeota bacterium]|nr:hypothetical protein [Candidatus Eremiobacteraeota bacterium]MCW5867533.1 hypothetical protein [Candidatus Eremiobacteraeota bacterium]